MALPVCPFPPDSANFQSQAPDAVIRVQLDGGQGAYRLNKLGGSTLVQCTWTLDLADYNTLYAFWRDTLVMGSLPFKIDLTLEGNTVTYTAHFVPASTNPTGLQSVAGATYTFQAVLECQT